MWYIIQDEKTRFAVGSFTTVINESSIAPSVFGRIDAPLPIVPTKVVHVTAFVLLFVFFFSLLSFEEEK